MKKPDVVSAICWVILGFIISIWSATFPFGSWEAPGPAFLPLASGLILILLGSILFFQGITRKEESSKEIFVPLVPSGIAFNRVALSLGGMLLSAALIDFLGFILTIFCLMLLLMRAIHPQKWGATIFYALVFALGSYILFQVVLKTTLPRGFIGF